MSAIPHVVIVLGRCRIQHSLFGIRFEESSPRKWFATWSFPVKEKSAKKEGYEKNAIKGTFQFLPSYPGCPCCKARSYYVCSCDGGRVVCWDGETMKVTCPWCKSSGTLRTGSIDTLFSGKDA